MHSIWYGRLMEKLQERSNTISAHLVEGGSKSYEEYRELVGYLRALREVRDMADEIDKVMIGDPSAAGPAN